MGEVGCIVRFTVHVPSHHPPEARTGYTVSDNSLDNIGVVVFSLVLVGFFIRVGLFRIGVLFPVGRFIIEVAS